MFVTSTSVVSLRGGPVVSFSNPRAYAKWTMFFGGASLAGDYLTAIFPSFVGPLLPVVCLGAAIITTNLRGISNFGKL